MCNRLNIHMKNLVLVFIIASCAFCKLCDEAQKSMFMSMNAISKRDSITNLFIELNTNMTTYNTTYNDTSDKIELLLTGFQPQAYYNDHHQVQSFVSMYTINVSMGVLSLGGRFNFSINYPDSTQNKVGWSEVTAKFDASSFTKKLMMIDGYLEWEPDVVSKFTLSGLLSMEYWSVVLTHDEQSWLNKLLNDQFSTANKMKENILNEINVKYQPILKKHLNHQEIISTNNITYQYANISFNFKNIVKDFEVTNSINKGIQAFFIFGLEEAEEECTILPKSFNQAQEGGLQQIFSFNQIKGAFKEALKNGLYDVTLSKTWEVPNMQFYMGDLGNGFSYANTFPATDRFDVKCVFNSANASQVKINQHDELAIYTRVPEICSIIYKSEEIIRVNFDITIVVQIMAMEKNLKVVVSNTGIFAPTFTSINPKFVLTSEALATFGIDEVVKGLTQKDVFGSGFPVIYRRYPGVKVRENYMVVFDHSEI